MSDGDVREEVAGRFYRALVSRDWDAMRDVFADDAEFGLGGRNPFAGEHRGPDAIVGVLREMVRQSDDTFAPVQADTWDICTSEHHVILLEWFQAQRNGRRLRAYLYFVCAFENGRIARMFAHSSEQYEFDAFWS